MNKIVLMSIDAIKIKEVSTLDVKEILYNTYLKLATPVSDLKDIAYAKLVTLALFIENRPLSLTEIIKSCSAMMKSFSAPEESVNKAITLLKIDRQIAENHGRFELVPNTATAMKSQLEFFQKIIIKILSNRFPKTIDTKILGDWFAACNETYFSQNADRLIEAYNKKLPLAHHCEQIIKPIIKVFNLERYEVALLQGYLEFLDSDDSDEQKLIWNLMQSLLATKIVAADISPEYFNILRYKNAELILDTNVLISLSVPRSEAIARSLESFGNVINSLGIKLYITRYTRDEYESVRQSEKKNSLLIWDRYSKTVLDNARHKSDFLRALLDLGCKTSEDVEMFFDEGLKIPEKIGGAKIIDLDKEISEIHFNIQTDKKLFGQIAAIFLEYSTYEKNEKAVIHDVLLTKIVKKLAGTRNIHVLTLDTSMEALALREINDKEEPNWVNLKSLIHTLALNGGGPQFDVKDIAPLVKIFMDYEEMSKTDKYDERDLLVLTEASDRTKEISDTQAVSLLNKIHRGRMAGSTEQATREARLELERTLRKKTSDLGQTLIEKDEKIKSLTLEMSGKSEKYRRERKRNIITWFFLKSLVALLLSALLFFYLISELIKAYHLQQNFMVWQILAAILAPTLFIYYEYNKMKGDLSKLEK